MAFHIQSTQTGHYLLSNGEEADQSVVRTLPPSRYDPATTVLLIEPPVQHAPTVGFVQSSQVPGLYIGYGNVDGGKYLVWTRTKERFPWLFHPTPDGQYNIIPANGEDLYWFDKFGVGIYDRIALKAGRDVQDSENVFRIMRA